MENIEYTFFQIYNAVDAIEDFFDDIQHEIGINCYESEPDRFPSEEYSLQIPED